MNFVYILEQYYAHGRRQHNKRSGASATLDSGSVGCDAERLKEMASRWSGKSARPAGETAGEYMHIPSRAPLSGEQRAQAEEAADCARRERRGKMQRKARAMTRHVPSTEEDCRKRTTPRLRRRWRPSVCFGQGAGLSMVRVRERSTKRAFVLFCSLYRVLFHGSASAVLEITLRADAGTTVWRCWLVPGHQPTSGIARASPVRFNLAPSACGHAACWQRQSAACAKLARPNNVGPMKRNTTKALMLLPDIKYWVVERLSTMLHSQGRAE